MQIDVYCTKSKYPRDSRLIINNQPEYNYIVVLSENIIATSLNDVYINFI